MGRHKREGERGGGGREKGREGGGNKKRRTGDKRTETSPLNLFFYHVIKVSGEKRRMETGCVLEKKGPIEPGNTVGLT